MGFWDTRTSSLNRLNYYYGTAKDYSQAVGPHVAAMSLAGAAGDYGAAFIHADSAFDDVRWALDYLIGYITGETYNYGILTFLYKFTTEGAAEYELTAAKIMAAWIDADADARMMTVMTLDELRREAWNKEFFSYKIAPPGGG